MDKSADETMDEIDENTAERISTEVTEPELVQEQRLRNEFIDSILINFKNTVERQAREFPTYFYLNAPTFEAKIALTFDDGPGGNYTPQILDILKAYDVRATFFLLGQNVGYNPEVARRIVSEGHVVGNHSYSHPDFRDLSVEEAYQNQVLRTQQIFEDVLRIKTIYFRPPYGAVTDEQINAFGNEGFVIVNWSIETFDWSDIQNSPGKMLNRVNLYLTFRTLALTNKCFLCH